jgi:ribosomal silencing factor RsfS
VVSEKAQKIIDEYNSETQFKAVAVEVAREVSQKQIEETKVVERSNWRFWFWLIIIILIIAIILRFVSKKWFAMNFPFLTRFKRFSEFKNTTFQ